MRDELQDLPMMRELEEKEGHDLEAKETPGLVRVSGLLRHEARAYRGINGAYRKSGVLFYNGRCVYIKISNPWTAMWCQHLQQASDDEAGLPAWCVGPRDTVGSGHPTMWAFAVSESGGKGGRDGGGPEEASAWPWRVFNYSTQSWEEQTGVLVGSMDDHRLGPGAAWCLCWCLHAWREAAASQVVWRIIACRVFSGWCSFSREQTRRAKILKKAIFRITQQSISYAWSTWTGHASRARELRSAFVAGCKKGNPSLVVNFDPRRLCDDPKGLLKGTYWPKHQGAAELPAEEVVAKLSRIAVAPCCRAYGHSCVIHTLPCAMKSQTTVSDHRLPLPSVCHLCIDPSPDWRSICLVCLAALIL